MEPDTNTLLVFHPRNIWRKWIPRGRCYLFAHLKMQRLAPIISRSLPASLFFPAITLASRQLSCSENSLSINRRPRDFQTVRDCSHSVENAAWLQHAGNLENSTKRERMDGGGAGEKCAV